MENYLLVGMSNQLKPYKGSFKINGSYCYSCLIYSLLFVHRPSVNISHFNLLLRNHWANCNQTLVEWSFDDPLSKLCPVIPTSNQDGRQAKNRKKGNKILIVQCCFSVSQNELKF